MCAGACVMSRLKRVVYAVSDPKMGFLGGAMKFHDLPTLNHSLSVESGALEAECAELLKTFFALKGGSQKPPKTEKLGGSAEVWRRTGRFFDSAASAEILFCGIFAV